MDYTALLKESKEEVPSANQLPSLYEICHQLTDGRAARGKRYDLAGILLVLVWAKLAGMSSILAVSEWAKDQETAIRASVGLGWKRMPCANTYSYVLARLDSQQVNAHLAAWFVRQLTPAPVGKSDGRHVHLAIDGKALKSTGEQAYGGEHPQQHLLHLYEVETGVVLHQIPIGIKTNEVGALKPFLTEVTCKGRVITADAAQSYHELPRLIKRAGGDVILIIKDNTPNTLKDLELFFEDPQADRRTWQGYRQREKGHGRLECRSILTSPDLNGLFFQDWGEIGQVFRLQRERTIKGKQSCEVRYGLTTLSQQFCPPQRLLGYVRAHWKGENHLHWRRDALLGEDRCRVRSTPAMEMLAVLRSYPKTCGTMNPKRVKEPNMPRTHPWKVSNELWERVEPLIPPPPSHAKGGRPRMPDRQAFEAMVYVLRTGIQWNALPRELGASSTVHDRFQEWERAGFFQALWQAGLADYDELIGLQWDWQAVDGAMSKAPFGHAATGKNPTDRGKSGTKRSLLTDGAGIPLALVIAGANRHDMKLLGATMEGLVMARPAPWPQQPHHLCLDAGYDYPDCEQLALTHQYVPHIRSRGQERQAKATLPGFRARRWVVERTHSWLNRSRRLLVRWEKKVENYLAFLHLACAQLIFHKVFVFG